MSKEKIRKLFAMPYLLLLLDAVCILVVLLLVILDKTFIAVFALGIVNMVFGIFVIVTGHSQIFKAKSRLFDSLFLFTLGAAIIAFSLLVFWVPDLPIL